MSVRVRYAPSPTGSPHVGNVRTAIYNWLYARKEGGVFIARLEDTDRDPTRFKPEYIQDIEQNLLFLGIEPDEWWRTPGAESDYVQSERLPLYRQAAAELIANGRAYRCYCTEERLKQMREQQQASGAPSGYDRRCRFLSPEDRARYEAEGHSFTVRLAVPLEGKTTYHDLVYGEITFENRLIDDQVLLKSNGWPTYHLAVVVDDHAEGITHVIRGEDWHPSTPKHILIYQAFGWEPPAWVHVPLILGADRKKLSKRHGSTQFIEFMREGYLPEAMFNFLVLLGWSPGEENRELFSVAEIVARFSLEGISKHAAVFDYDKLRWMNGSYIRAAAASDPERLAKLCLPYLVEAGLVSDPPGAEEEAYVAQILPLMAERMKLLSEIAPITELFFHAPETAEEKGRRKWLVGSSAMALLERAYEEFASLGDAWTIEAMEAATDRIAASLGIERAPVIHTLRVATTGRTVGPGLFETLSVLGRERVLSRLERAKSWVEIADVGA